MKTTLVSTIAISLLFAVSAFAQSEGEQTQTKWFDMENCAICKHMTADKDLMTNMKWENHIIPNGMLTVSIVPEKMKPTMEKAKKGVESTIKELKGGKQLKCCGFCQSMGKLDAAGAKKTEIKSIGGDIMMMTSSDPAVIKQIHAHVKKTQTAHKQMEAMMKKASGHSNHDNKHAHDKDHGDKHEKGDHDEKHEHDKDGEHKEKHKSGADSDK